MRGTLGAEAGAELAGGGTMVLEPPADAALRAELDFDAMVAQIADSADYRAALENKAAPRAAPGHGQ